MSQTAVKNRLGNGLDVDRVEWNGKNDSGWRATDYKVIIKKDEVKTTYGETGIVVADASKDQEEWVVNYGVIVSKGDAAFTRGVMLNAWENGPEIGDRVMIANYVGQRFTSSVDGKTYFIVNDKDIIGVEDK